MKEKSKKRQIAKISVFITSIFVIFMSITYAMLAETLTGTRKVVITAGALDLVLEEENEITISDALPMYDEVGMIQEDVFKFRLVNNTSMATNYTLKLQEIETGTLDKSIVKYGLIKDGERTIDFVSNIVDGVIDEGTINGNNTINYELRLWIDSKVTEITKVENKFLSFKMGATASQDTVATDSNVAVDWTVGDSYLDTVQVGEDYYFVKISNHVFNRPLIGYEGYLELNSDLTNCGDECITEGVLTEELLNSVMTLDETTGALNFKNILYIVTKPFTLNNITGSPGIWIGATSQDGGNTLIPFLNKIKLEGEEEKVQTVNASFAGITTKAIVPTDTLFNYGSDGCRAYTDTFVTSCVAPETSGLYVMDDDDGPSYFYRGNVNNLVKFGEYTEDYYVYEYVEKYYVSEDVYDTEVYQFTRLAECQQKFSDCSELNKTLKYGAGSPMYWRIIRVNGDGTIRMLYAGTTPDAEGLQLGIGTSKYNSNNYDIKYTGYTYDKLTSETDSTAKSEIDRWYSNVLENTIYNDKIVTGKFCNDTSGYNSETGFFNAFSRSSRNLSTLTGNSTPTFKCSTETDPNFGGKYNLKAGLMTVDELVAAGGQGSATCYAFDKTIFLLMSPYGSNNDGSFYNSVSFLSIPAGSSLTVGHNSLRPVINLRADVVFKSGTDGSKTNPYEIELGQ